MREPTPSGERRRRLPGRLLRFGERAFAVVGLVMVVYHMGFDLSQVVSGSMAPTLRGTSTRDGDWVLTERITYRLRRPRRWELVAFRNDEGTQVMKRVVGLPGETISLKGRRIAVDGAVAPRPDPLDGVEYWAFGNLYGGRSAECGRGYYTLGDDSRDSQDSRFEGPLPPDRIAGRPWLILWPPEHIGFLNP